MNFKKTVVVTKKTKQDFDTYFIYKQKIDLFFDQNVNKNNIVLYDFIEFYLKNIKMQVLYNKFSSKQCLNRLQNKLQFYWLKAHFEGY